MVDGWQMIVSEVPMSKIFFYGNYFGPSSRNQNISYILDNKTDQLALLSCYCVVPREPEWPEERSMLSSEFLGSIPMCGT